jgi:sugar/nucleoside kinase (ribokinase family)
VTPTYTKPIVADPTGERELNRLDIQNRTPTPTAIEDWIIETLMRLAPSADAIAVLDQVAEENHGVITTKVREALARIGEEHPSLPILCDSRAQIGKFRHVMIKPNRNEAVAAWLRLGGVIAGSLESVDPSSELEPAARSLRGLTNRPVFITDGPYGQYVMGDEGLIHRPSYPVDGPLDPVGAGDSTAAGILSALCCGTSLPDAASFGNLVASVTVQKLGTTGTASPDELRKRWQDAEKLIG